MQEQKIVGLPWHIDSFIPYQGSNPWIIVVTIPLEPYTINNGCFQVVKGSHQFGKYVSQKSNKNVTSVEADPGDAIIWNGGIWHRTAPNIQKAPDGLLFIVSVDGGLSLSLIIPKLYRPKCLQSSIMKNLLC